jgi:hypothetical protein
VLPATHNGVPSEFGETSALPDCGFTADSTADLSPIRSRFPKSQLVSSQQCR